ncbi:dynamin family domain-containing protein [Trichoderma breve]|uniref:Dynamin family domain-containing protein n=1 Tax=Trichoderma breve TaxID=2034170 RepID=A0A9W9EEY8_9HYPO|nr:dynamin family domain-containing protein [Trichoderma breve]KAJ4865473.1 dynamin family domain-containing protein [Trichoderma breve]
MGDTTALGSATAEQLNNAETRRLLDTIDGLRDLSIAGIDLPQIIVVGDQCSGKSSVLEAISRVHFPVSDGICTRFPTELVLRRAPIDSTDLRIRYATDVDAANQPRMPFHETGFQRSELPDIISRAKKHIDIPSLTLVDLPGIFHSGTSSQPQEWKATVDYMVGDYMKQKNSIILMVVSADLSLSKHAILDMALQHDTARERTIGVITKVDLCPGSNLEDEYLRLIKSSLPELIRDIDGNLQNRQRRLAKLGTTRTTSDEMRDYLLSTSTAFHKLAEHAVEGRYNDPFFATPSDPEASSKVKLRKLRALLRNLNYVFDFTMREKGAKYKMNWDEPQPRENPLNGLTDEEMLIDALGDMPINSDSYFNLYDFPDSVVEDKGAEFSGLPSNDFIMQLFRDQSEPWQRIIFDYILEDDERTRDAILTECVDPFFDSMNNTLKDKLDEIMRPYTSGHGIPLEIEFRAGVWRRKLRRMKSDSADLLDKNSIAYNTTEYRMLKPEDVLNVLIQSDTSNYSHFGIDIAVDMMLTHYQMSRRTFTDNVVHLVVENCLISKLPDILSARVVTQMSDEIVKRLVEESDEVKRERSQLADEIEKLKTGLQSCQRSRPRDFSDLPEAFVEMAPKRDAPKTVAPKTDSPKTDALETDVTKRKIRVKLPPVSLPERKIAAPNSKFLASFEPATTASTSSTNSGQSTTAESSKQGQTSTAPTPTPLPFGMRMEPTTAAPKSSVFGSTTTSTSTATTTPLPVFGSTTAAATTSTASPFGSTATTTNTSTTSAFGSTAATTSTPSAFGSIAANTTRPSAFGSMATGTSTISAFGSTAATISTPSAFGSTAATTSAPSAFVSTATSTPTPSAFGSIAATTSKPSAFGSTAATTSTPSAFGSTAISSFFGPKPAIPSTRSSIFGSTTAAPPFNSATTTASIITPSDLGSNTTPAVAAPAFGSSSTPSAFGSTVGPPSRIGLFGTTYSIYDPPGTNILTYQAYLEQDPGYPGNLILSFANIACHGCYKSWSVDELRLVDYAQGRRPPVKDTAPFGSSAASQPQSPEETSSGSTSPPSTLNTLIEGTPPPVPPKGHAASGSTSDLLL